MSVKENRAEWVEFVTENVDIFMTDHCGYWLCGVMQKPGVGWIVRENDVDEFENLSRKEIHARDLAAGETFLATGKATLPYRLLDRKVASRAFTVGIKKWGADSWDDGEWDAGYYDYIIQMALLGEETYC